MINLLAMGWLNLPRWAHSWVEIRKPFRLIPHWTRLQFESTPLHQYNVRMIKFEWDGEKAAINVEKHGVTFEEAQSVFYDEIAVQFFDEEHSISEDRFFC